MDLISYRHEFLDFTLKYLEFIVSNLRQHSHQELQFKEEYSKEVFLCVKSSFTYAAKLLNLILSSSNKASDGFTLANSLLDLVVSLESFLGPTYAARVIAVTKQWLPDLILALGSKHFQTPVPNERSSESANNEGSSSSSGSVPIWLSTLAKIRIREFSETGSDDEGPYEPKDFPSFEKLVQSMVLSVRGNAGVLDAVGTTFLEAIAAGLEKNDLKLVFGLVLFVALKLVRYEKGEWEGLNHMLESLHDVYPRMERAAEMSGDEDEKEVLRSAVMLLEPVWTRYADSTPGDYMEEEE